MGGEMYVHVDLRMATRSDRVTMETLLEVIARRMTRHFGWSEICKFKINLALDELVTNIFSYGDAKSRQTPEVGIDIFMSSGEKTRIVVSDDSYPFNPILHGSEEIAADTGKSSGEVPVGGFGIGLVKDIATEVSYMYKNGKNRLTLYILGEALE